MSVQSSPPLDGSQPTYRRLKLVVSTPEHQHSTSRAAGINHTIKEESSRGSSPTRPSYSPVTPTLSHSSTTGPDNAVTEWIDEPEPLPVSLEENADAIALQATLSLLQMQRQQSLRDIKGLNKLRQEALEDPEAFVEELRSGKLTASAPVGIDFDQDSDRDSDSSVDDKKPSKQERSRFGKLPSSQNVVRCPPIEWAKYRVTGDSLDRLHESQRQYPGVSQQTLARGVLPQPHEVMAPYRPFTDRLESIPPSTDTRNYTE